jgi:hypothetical protein
MIMYVEVSDPDHNIPNGVAATNVADHEDESKPTKETSHDGKGPSNSVKKDLNLT